MISLHAIILLRNLLSLSTSLPWPRQLFSIISLPCIYTNNNCPEEELDDKAAELLAASYAKARETKLNNSTSLVDHKLVPQPRKTKQPTPGQTTLQKIKRATRAEAKNVKMIQDQARHQVAVIQRHQQAQRSMAIAKPKHVSVAASAKKTFQREHVACTAEQTGAFDSALSARSQVHLAKVDEEGKRLRQQLREMDATKRGLTVTAAQNPAAQSITTNSPPRSATKPAKKGHALLFKNKPIEQTPGYMGTYSVIINKDGSKTKTRIDAPSTSSKSPPAAASSPPQRVASAAPVDGVSPMSLSSATPASSTPSSPPSDVGHGPLRPLKRRRAPVDVFVKKPRY